VGFLENKSNMGRHRIAESLADPAIKMRCVSMLICEVKNSRTMANNRRADYGCALGKK
jgi:hypothetical protein